MASSTPDRMPGSAVGSTTVRMVRDRLEPSAMLASRRWSGTSRSISSVERMMIGSIRHARASAPAKPVTPSTPKRITQIVKMNRPMMIDGTPVITSAKNRRTEARRPFLPYSWR